MRIVISGNIFELESINPDIDQAFFRLHSSFIGNDSLVLDNFNQNVQTFLNHEFTDSALVHKYFQNFTIIWTYYRNQGLWDRAEHVWKIALEPVINWEIKTRRRVHKGDPFYFWGMTALLKGDVDHGYSLMHQALEEDVLTSPDNYQNFPAYAFASLNYSKIDQAFRPWVIQEAEYLNTLIKKYCASRNRDFSLEDFKERYLDDRSNRDAIYTLSYTITRIDRMKSLPPYLFNSPFANQLIQNLLFDIIKVIDFSLSKKNTGEWKFSNQISYLSKKAGFLINGRDIYTLGQNNSTLNQKLKDLMADKYQFENGNFPSDLQKDLLITYLLRNYFAHLLTPKNLILDQFTYFQEAVFNTLFLTVETLY